MYLYQTDSGDTLFYGIREVEKRQLSKVYSEISDACNHGKRYCYINFYLSDRVKELLIHEGFHIQVEYYDVWYYYVIRWGNQSGKTSILYELWDKIHSFLRR